MLRTLLERIQGRLIAAIMVPLMTHRINRSTYPLTLTAEGFSVMKVGPRALSVIYISVSQTLSTN